MRRTVCCNACWTLPLLNVTQYVLEMFRRALSAGSPRHLLDRLANRLNKTKIASEARKLVQSQAQKSRQRLAGQ